MNLQELIKQLPYELIEIIRKYTYRFQNKELLLDIRDYNYSKKLVLQLYYTRFIHDIENEANSDKNWLSNDIDRYLNEDQATMFGLTDKYYNTLLRLYTFKTPLSIDKFYVKKLQNYPINKEINIAWGLLTPIERKEMMNMFYNKEEINISKLSLAI